MADNSSTSGERLSAWQPNAGASIAPQLGLWDTVSIIVGIVVGTAIFRSSPMVFSNAGGSGTAMGLWLVGGALAWCGAVCYAELATAYPRDGGDYEYLNRAFGPWYGFLFAWAQLTTVVSGNIAIMACAFADYALHLWPGLHESAAVLAIAPVVGLSVLNALGVVAGKRAQNVLTTAKVVGIAMLVVAGFWVGGQGGPSPAAPLPPSGGAAAATDFAPSIGLALVFVLYAYGGWCHAPYVAAEVRDVRRNLPRALLLGIAAITIVYLAVNAAYIAALGFDSVRRTQTPAADVLVAALGPWGGRAISTLVMLSALGAINGMILTASRVYAVWGSDYPALRWLATWDRQRGSPLAAIAAQAVIAVLLISLVGTQSGRQLFDAAIGSIGIAPLAWGGFQGGFEMLVAGSAPVYWGLTLLTIAALVVLRRRDADRERPFRVPLFPLPALIFAAACVFMLYASLAYAGWLALVGGLPLAGGGVLWLIVRPKSKN